jgi:pimeloyl-[acyl-carrier protein] methyl ester esterase
LSPARPQPALYSESNARESGGAGDSEFADPLVLLHGWGMNLRVFDGLRAALGEHYQVAAIDLPGHGRSPWPAQALPQQQLAALAAMLPPGATLVGWSLGGQFALQLAAQPALAVRRIVLIASSPRFVRAPDWPHGLPAATLQQFAERLERDAAATIADFIELLVRGSANAATVRATLQSSLQHHGMAQPQALRAGLALLEHNDLRELARHIDVPALLIAGEYDRVTPPQAAQALAQLLPRAELLQVERAGHAPFLSHPEEVSAALLAFTRSDERQRHRPDPRRSS